ncbi:capsular polysaccharide biosynthesis protein [Psychrobacter sp. CAL346-MNA-CIBAN-0220]|uniref:capsular polysaccharide biosynthesis protein n=1 Tax=Psychrobacter sp. CAL346-MNA-CIBAN-0220 TaxID=3140457 RepID=UPI003331B86D
MIRSAADDDKISVKFTTSVSADVLQSPLLSKTLAPNRLAVIGKGMRHNNELLAQVLQADIQRWYLWSGLQQRLSTKTATLFPKLTQRRFNYLSNPLPDAFIGWGHKKSYQRATKAAKRQGLTTLSIEDGFLRSLDSGISSRHGLSVVIDDIGIYFDLTQPSRLEQLIIERAQNDSNQASADKDHAQGLIARIGDEQLSKYNAVTHCPSLDKLVADANAINSTLKPHILLIDQVAGDASITGAGADKRQFKRMLKAACRAHPDAHIWIKAHPAAKAGYLTDLKLPKNVRVLSQALNPIKLLTQVNEVYTVSSHMGFEALLLGKTVHCFGVNWYSGWGLTDDSGAPKRLLKKVKQRRQLFSASSSNADNSLVNAVRSSRKKKFSAKLTPLLEPSLEVSLEMLFYSAYIDYSHYVDPATKQACDIDTAIEWLLTNRYWQTYLAGALTVYEFSRWKLPFVKAFVDLPRTSLFIKPKPRLKNLLHPDHFRVNYQQPLLVWGLAKRQQLQKRLQKPLQKQTTMPQLAVVPPIYCMEDGFIRSNGLGATLLAPLSVVIDKRGIYYDATQTSDLEVLLRDCQVLTPRQTARVHTLQNKLLTQRVSKYNVGNTNTDASSSQTSWLQAAKTTSKLRILIVGQVEDDLSVQYCGSRIQTNSALIERVRQDNPNAYLIYKPHPDVEAGLRAGKVASKYLKDVQAVAYDTAMPDCLACVDEVHTISSLTGFEALLRNLKVVCYGLPFYAGWGLTIDKDAALSPKANYLQRRQRSTPLILEQLLYCALIRYPLYRLPEGYGLAQVEQVIDHLYPPTAMVAIDKVTDDKNINNSQMINAKAISNIPMQIKRQAATRFMQQRYRFQQLLRKRST